MVMLKMSMILVCMDILCFLECGVLMGKSMRCCSFGGSFSRGSVVLTPLVFPWDGVVIFTSKNVNAHVQGLVCAESYNSDGS